MGLNDKSERITQLRIYLVGGAVRDELLGLLVREKDWVVVGTTPEEMITRGFKPVGKEFPVFLHPQTHEEYTLARTERKTTKGYKGFSFYTTPNVTLEEDLKRRDLTINAIAKTPSGKLIDPYGGQQDLKNKILRHVSPAFQEDPVRILRLARLATKFPEFSIHPETLDLMKEMTNKGEVNALIPNRVWQELVRAIANKAPTRFFTVLHDCGALAILFYALHPENKGVNALSQIASRTPSPVMRFAALLSDLSPKVIQKLALQYRVPNEYSDLAIMISRFQGIYKYVSRTNEKELLNFILKTDALRRDKRFEQFLFICTSLYPALVKNNDKIKKAIKAIKSINVKPLQERQLKGENFAKALETLRLEAIRFSIVSDILSPEQNM
ncbi:multifunctional CCA tRNA nucleotidyl transferase/2'3'-cyclic phosphodiesterase/2'nucleotidase/phosphatase [Coxiella endosymbiont of Dermacentor marginatus]|uniref:multifunctional CCA tRNA nucleotidyl transferase/2'3'-cyclic phosphodiesterase/2'nucleotidase/phosphatase n=1 Tax=Coxiella endosymbiont of Dermacentor marginatus TaxID=1656159 RepID=UPI0029C9E24B|nr:multifunctional CCA tRNA nucleotidyl transferase/2'3'-cyclic phosphodiesterase/2'nucleotidase/phosphatase [Coxiella endosymbiont of Dermacentor marginatus]